MGAVISDLIVPNLMSSSSVGNMDRDKSLSLLEYEKSRLKEIYSLLYPDDRVLLLVENANEESFSRPVVIEYKDTDQFLKAGSSIHIHLELGTEKAPLPTKIFRLRADFRHEPPVPAHAKQSLPRKVIGKLRQVLSRRTPLVYECIKEIYLNLLERQSNHSFDRLLNLNNPKDQSYPRRKHSIADRKAALVSMHWLDVGGAEAFAVDSCGLFHKKGYETIVLSAHNARRYYFQKLAASHTVYEIDRQVPPGEETRFICALIRQCNVSVIHNHHNLYIYESLAALRVFAPDIHVIDSLHIDEKNRFGGGFPRISIVWANYIDQHHVISHRLKQLLTAHGVPSHSVIIGHLGKDLTPPVNFRIADSLAAKKISLCFVGRMTGQKRPPLVTAMLVWAVKEGRRQGFDVKVDMVGDGFYLPAVQSFIQHSGVKSAFMLHGAGTNVEKLMQQCDMLVLGSENEGITLVAYEAFRSGCLVASTNVGAQSELVPDEMLLPASTMGAYKQWKNVFRRVLQDPIFVQQAQASFVQKALAIKGSSTAEEAISNLLD